MPRVVSSFEGVARPRYPRLKAHLRLDVVGPDLAIAISESHHTVFEGRIVPLLASYLDGRRTVAEIAQALGGSATVVDVGFGLSLLAEEDCLVWTEEPRQAVDGVAAQRAAYVESLGLSASAADRNLATQSVEVLALGGLDPGPWHDALARVGVRSGEGGEHVLVLTRDHRASELAELHTRMLAEGRAWLLVRPVGREVWIGPLFRPPETGCWACLDHRLARSRPHDELIAAASPRPLGTVETPRPFLPATLALATQSTAIQVLRWLAGDGRHLENHLLVLDTATLESRSHHFARRSHCPDCASVSEGSRPAGEPPPVELEAVPLDPLADGGYRTVRPEETLRRLAHHISPLTGFVGEIEDAGSIALPSIESDGSAGRRRAKIRVFFADHELPGSDPRRALVTGQRRRSAGKGLSAEQARASALCEALERVSGIFRGDEPRIRARYVDVADRAVHPSSILHYSAEQYRRRERWSEGPLGYAWVPMPFDEEVELEWSPLWSLSEQRIRYLPTAYCYFNVPQSRDHRFCLGDSNGNSAGNTLEEAVLQGFLELAERDAVAVWWYNQIRRPEVAVESFERPEYLELLGLYRHLGRQLHVFDVTHDLGIPTLAAISWAEEGPPRPLLGFGAHLDAEVALGRALTEMNQFLPGLLAGRDRVILSRPDPDLSHHVPEPGALKRQKCDFPTPDFDDLRQAVLHCVEAARRRGLETLVLDQTRADIDFPVVKVVVPGLRHYWPRFAPGRLYDAPVELGWLDEPRTESELEPAHIMI